MGKDFKTLAENIIGARTYADYLARNGLKVEDGSVEYSDDRECC